MSFKTDYSRVAGLGSAKEGAGHWWSQRISSIALVPLTLFFVYAFGSTLGGDRQEVLAMFSSPVISITTILFLVAGFHHLHQGLVVVVEDYVHSMAFATALRIASTLGCWLFASLGIFATARIAFGFAG